MAAILNVLLKPFRENRIICSIAFHGIQGGLPLADNSRRGGLRKSDVVVGRHDRKGRDNLVVGVTNFIEDGRECYTGADESIDFTVEKFLRHDIGVAMAYKISEAQISEVLI